MTHKHSAAIVIMGVHSAVSITTNSSSELFVIGGERTIAAIRNAVCAIITLYNNTNAENLTYDEMFCEPVYGKDYQHMRELAWYVYDDAPSYGSSDEAYKLWLSEKVSELRKTLCESIIIRTTGDNSAPYEIVSAITDLMNAVRYHLG